MKYLLLTLKHKWFVLVAGLRLGVPFWRLLVHDLSKLGFAELPHYQRQFFGRADDPVGFVRCWLHHQNRNDHHWEYWIPRTGHNRCTPPHPDNEPLPMPDAAILEMVADWMAAGRAYEGRWADTRTLPWAAKNLGRMNLHRVTKDYLAIQLRSMGYDGPLFAETP